MTPTGTPCWGTRWSGGHKGLMTGIMREEWGNNGFSTTDNVLTTYVNGVVGVLAGVTTFDAMLPYVINQLPQYENDAVIVNAMREACHHNLYALANSSGMNGIGALMDRTNGRFGKFRPFMLIGNLIMAASILVLYCLTPVIPDTMMWARYAAFVAL